MIRGAILNRPAPFPGIFLNRILKGWPYCPCGLPVRFPMAIVFDPPDRYLFDLICLFVLMFPLTDWTHLKSLPSSSYGQIDLRHPLVSGGTPDNPQKPCFPLGRGKAFSRHIIQCDPSHIHSVFISFASLLVAFENLNGQYFLLASSLVTDMVILLSDLLLSQILTLMADRFHPLSSNKILVTMITILS